MPSIAPSVLIVSAAMGAGHDGVAYELQRRLVAEGATAEVVDYLQMMPGRAGPFYRAVYQGQLRYAPASYEWLYGRIDRGLLAPTARWLGRMGRAKVLQAVRDGKHDLVVSTYPLGCQAAGALRRSGKLGVPAVGFLTDVDVHGLWLHPGVDLNLTVWDGSAQVARDRSGTPSRAVGPVLPPVFRDPVTPAERASARASLALPDPAAKVVLVVAGSWGVGDIADTARAIEAAGVGIPVVLCGRNEALRAELEAEGTGIALGWTTDVRSLLAAADALVHNAGGLSCLEGFAVGTPVIGYACLPGHGHRNAEAMRDAGVAAHAETADDLIEAIRRLAGTAEGAAMAARARALFRVDPTLELLRLAKAAPVAVPQQRRAPVAPRWAVRTAGISAVIPLTLGGLSFGVAQAAQHGLDVAEGGSAVYAAAELSHEQAANPTVVQALRRHRVSAVIGTGRNAPTPTDVALLFAAGVGVIGADHGSGRRDPRRQRDDIDQAAKAIADVTHEQQPPVLLLHRAGLVEHMVAWNNDFLLGRPTQARGGEALPRLVPGTQLVLDLRRRTPAQLVADLAAMDVAVTAAHLPEQPMRVLWKAL